LRTRVDELDDPSRSGVDACGGFGMRVVSAGAVAHTMSTAGKLARRGDLTYTVRIERAVMTFSVRQRDGCRHTQSSAT
jgi:hypothetical protein